MPLEASYCIIINSLLFQRITILITKTTAAQNDDALSYHRVRGLCFQFQAVVFMATIYLYNCTGQSEFQADHVGHKAHVHPLL